MRERPSVCRALRRASIFRGALAGLLSALLIPQAVSAQPSCPAGPRQVTYQLPHIRAALTSGAQIVIVAIGSSSTEGIGASDRNHGYPAVLQAVLGQAMPKQHIAVINRGIGGQDAPEELTRLESDVVAIRPQLVIWQVGANGAMRHADPMVFKRMVTEGVHRLQTAGIDVILMDNQRSPRVDASTDHIALEGALAQVAHDSGASLFSRGALMDAWEHGGAPPAEFISADGLHHNDRGYYCVGRALADSIVAGIGQQPQTASR
jgi:acyl-CoA thioesterase I